MLLLTSPIHFSIFKLFLGYNNFTKKKSFIGKKNKCHYFQTCFELYTFSPYSQIIRVGSLFLQNWNNFFKDTCVLLPTKALDWDLLRDFCNFIRNNNNTSLLIWDVWRNNFRAIPHQKINVHFKFLVKLLNIQKFQF